MAQKYIPGQIIIAFKNSAFGPALPPGPEVPAGTPLPLIRRALLLLANVRFKFAATEVATLFRVNQKVVSSVDLPIPDGPLTPALQDFIDFAIAAAPPPHSIDVEPKVREICRKYIRVTMPPANVRAALEYVRGYPSLIEFAEPVPARYFLPVASETQPSTGGDVPLSLPWSHNTIQWSDEVRESWGCTEIRNIAVLDSGVDTTHDAVHDVVVPANSYSSTDEWGHGTAVTSIIASRKGKFHGEQNGGGLLPPENTRVLMYKVADEGTPVSGITFPVNFDLYMTVIADLTTKRSAAKPVLAGGLAFPIRVVNMSFGGPECSLTETALLRQAFDAGLHMVACAGNRDGTAGDSSKTWFPAALTTVTSVSALDRTVKRWTSSKFVHPFKPDKQSVDLAAPGVGIDGAWPVQGAKLIYKTSLKTFRGRIWLEGSSFAAPFVTAAAALLFIKDANNSPKGKDIHTRLCTTHTRSPLHDEGLGAGVLDMLNIKR